MKASSICFASIIAFLACTSLAQTTIPEGYVSGIWDTDHSPYLIEGNIYIPDDSTLTIEPGVKAEFQGHYSLAVFGRLLAIGTEEDSILFTVIDTTGFSDPDTTSGSWNGIRFLDTPVDNDSSKIVYCRLEYGKAVGPVWHLNAGGTICILQFGKVLISNCLITNNRAGSPTEDIPVGGGLYLFRSDVIIRDNTFLNNRADFGGALYFDDSDPVIDHNVFRNNIALSGGAISFAGSDPIFSDNVIEENYAETGAGVAIGGICNTTFTGDKILNNIAGSHGGGILVQNSFARCDGLTIDGNRAQWGGGIGVQGGEFEADGCLFENNYAEIWGGGIAGDYATLDLNNCTFKKDTSNWGSGGLHMDHAEATIMDCKFIENVANFGGGFHAVYSKIDAENNEFVNNQAQGAGGVHIEDSDCLIDRCTFQGNKALNGASGAIDYTVDSTIFGRSCRFSLHRSSITGNSATAQYGGVHIEQAARDFSMIDLLIDSCLISENHSDVYSTMRIGGDIEDFVVSNSIFSHNKALRYSSGPGFINNAKGKVFNCIFNSNYSSFTDSTKSVQGASMLQNSEVEFFNCTFTDTSSADGIGLSLRTGAKANVVNCIFRGIGNRPINLVSASGPGCRVDVNYCNVEYGMDSIYVSDTLSMLIWGNGNISEDPLFVDMENGNLHLQDESPCIGAGINSFILNDKWYTAPTRDIEGTPRPYPEGSIADMGACENMLGVPLNTGFSRNIDAGKSELLGTYPNPFRDIITISYQLAVPCRVDLCIYNITGQKIKEFVSENQPAGIFEVRWDGSGFENGQYFYVLKTDGGSIHTGKLILLK